MSEYWQQLAPGFYVSDYGKKLLKQLLKKVSFEEILPAMDISSERYLVFNDDETVTRESWDMAFDKVSAICHVRKKAQENPAIEHFYKIKHIAKCNCPKGFDEPKAKDLIETALRLNIPIDDLYKVARECRHWPSFRDEMQYTINQHRKLK